MTKLRITTTRKRTINISISAHRAFCAKCNAEVQMLMDQQAAEFLTTGEQHIEDLVAARKVHAIKIASGSLQVCGLSLVNYRRQS